MGYVRMIRSGGLHCCSNAIRYNISSQCLSVVIFYFAILDLSFPLRALHWCSVCLAVMVHSETH